MYRIYKITNIKTNKIYIGQTNKSPEDRLNEHIMNAENGKIFHLSKAIRKYGKENFIIETIDYAFNKNDINEK